MIGSHSFIIDNENDFQVKKGFCKKKFIKLCEIIGNNKYWIIFINVLVVYSLIADYLRILIFRQSGDIFFDILTCIVFFSFVMEIIIYLITVKNYSCSFYFFIDTISTLLLVVDVLFISNEIFYGEDSSSNNTSDLITRLGKYFRIIRLIRILKLLKDSPASQNQDLEPIEFKVKLKYFIIFRKRKKALEHYLFIIQIVQDYL